LFGGGPQDLVLHGQLPDLAFGLPQRPIIGRPIRPLALQGVLAALQEVVPPGRQPVRLHLQLPGELVEGLAAQQPQHRLGLLARRPPRPGPVATGLLVLVLVVHRHDRHLHPCLSGVQDNRERWTALLPDPAETAAGSERDLDAEVENLRAATDWLIGHADATRVDAHLIRLWPLYRRRGWFRETQAVLTAALERNGVPVLEQARWHRLLGGACMQLGEAGPARQHFERTLALLGSLMPASPLGWLDVLATQSLHRRSPGTSLQHPKCAWQAR
jgi:hypothetical protein